MGKKVKRNLLCVRCGRRFPRWTKLGKGLCPYCGTSLITSKVSKKTSSKPSNAASESIPSVVMDSQKDILKGEMAIVVDTSVFFSDAADRNNYSRASRELIDLVCAEHIGFTTKTAIETARRKITEAGGDAERLEKALANIGAINDSELPQSVIREVELTCREIKSRIIMNRRIMSGHAHGFGRYAHVLKGIPVKHKGMYHNFKGFIDDKFKKISPGKEDVGIMACAAFLKEKFEKVFLASFDTHFVSIHFPSISLNASFNIVPETIYVHLRVISGRPDEILSEIKKSRNDDCRIQ